MQRKNSTKEKQEQHNKSDWGGPQQDKQTKKDSLPKGNSRPNDSETEDNHDEFEAFNHKMVQLVIRCVAHL